MKESERASRRIATAIAKTNSISAPYVTSKHAASDAYLHTRDIDINDLRNRYAVTRPDVLADLQKSTGCRIGVRGKYYPNRTLALKEREPPMHLRISSDSKSALDEAVTKINEMLRGPSASSEAAAAANGALFVNGRWNTKVSLGFVPDAAFNVRGRIIGPNGSFFKSVQSRTNCKIQVKGLGSNFIESDTGREANEPFFLHITCPTQAGLNEAVAQCKQLLTTVKEEHVMWQAQRSASILSAAPPPPSSATAVFSLDADASQLSASAASYFYTQQQQYYAQYYAAAMAPYTASQYPMHAASLSVPFYTAANATDQKPPPPPPLPEESKQKPAQRNTSQEFQCQKDST